MVLFLELTMLAAKALSPGIVLVVLLVDPADARKRIGAKVGDKGSGSAIRTIAYTKLLTFGQARVS